MSEVCCLHNNFAHLILDTHHLIGGKFNASKLIFWAILAKLMGEEAAAVSIKSEMLITCSEQWIQD